MAMPSGTQSDHEGQKMPYELDDPDRALLAKANKALAEDNLGSLDHDDIADLIELVQAFNREAQADLAELADIQCIQQQRPNAGSWGIADRGTDGFYSPGQVFEAVNEFLRFGEQGTEPQHVRGSGWAATVLRGYAVDLMAQPLFPPTDEDVRAALDLTKKLRDQADHRQRVLPDVLMGDVLHALTALSNVIIDVKVAGRAQIMSSDA